MPERELPPEFDDLARQLSTALAESLSAQAEAEGEPAAPA